MRGGGKATALLGSAADAETAAAHESVQLFGCRVSLSSAAGSGGGGGGRAGGAEASEQVMQPTASERLFSAAS